MKEERKALFKASNDKRCPITGFMFVYPEVEDRIVNIGEPIAYDD